MENAPINKSKLFLASCVALTVTAMTFGIRAGIMGELGTTFEFTNRQLGIMAQMAFLGFPLSMIVGGLIYPKVGPKPLMWTAFIAHLVGLILTIVSTSFIPFLVSTFLIG